MKQQLKEQWRLKGRDELAKWLEAHAWDVVGTLDFRYNMTERSAKKALTYYWNKVDRTFFGNNVYRKGERIQRFVFYQTGTYGLNPHFHFVANSPQRNAEQFALLLQKLWRCGVAESGSRGRFEAVTNKTANARYLTHEYWLLGNDTFEVFSSYLDKRREGNRKYTGKQRLAVIRRLLRQKVA